MRHRVLETHANEKRIVLEASPSTEQGICVIDCVDHESLMQWPIQTEIIYKSKFCDISTKASAAVQALAGPNAFGSSGVFRLTVDQANDDLLVGLRELERHGSAMTVGIVSDDDDVQ